MAIRELTTQEVQEVSGGFLCLGVGVAVGVVGTLIVGAILSLFKKKPPCCCEPTAN